jgi:ketosteroid isomerase-like protein
LGNERARQLVEAFVDALERADPGSLVGLLTEDATWTMPRCQAGIGPAAIAEFLASFGFNELLLREVCSSRSGAARA